MGHAGTGRPRRAAVPHPRAAESPVRGAGADSGDDLGGAGTAPRRRLVTSAIRPVHPVWCDAPSPAPLSPWKYSLNTRLSARRGRPGAATPPKQGRRPSGPGTKIEIRRSTTRVSWPSRGSSRPARTGRTSPTSRCRWQPCRNRCLAVRTWRSDEQAAGLRPWRQGRFPALGRAT